MNIKLVRDSKTERDFIKLPWYIYRNDPNWIPHLIQDVKKVFDPKRNKAFRNGEAERWVLYKEEKAVGSIAAFVDSKYSKGMKDATGGIGFFESVDDQATANVLLDTAVKWLKERDVKVVDGPINFGEKNMFWGLLVDNFTSPSSYGMNYHLPYYKTLFENYGFEVYYEQFVYHRDMMLPAQDIFVRKSQILFQSGEYSISHVRGWSLDKIAECFCTVYNNAWGGHHGFKKMPLAQAKKTVEALKPVMDRDIVVFAFHHDKPIAFYVNIPELNDIFKHVHGNLNWIGKLKFLYHKWRKTPNTMVGLVFGVDREYHGKGVEGALIVWAGDNISTLGRYKDTVLTWIGDFNPKMISVVENLGTTKHRTLATYRYMIDKSIPFERMPAVG